MLSRLEHRIRRLANQWMFRSHAAEPGEVFLHRRRVYIMPTHPGLGFCVMLIALLIGSINYNLSLGFGFTFLIASCAVIDMLLTYRNLAHLHLAAGRAPAVFAGEDAQFELHLINRRNYPRYAIWLDFLGENMPAVEQAVDIASHASKQVSLSTPARKRGWLPAPRVRLQTRFPLGLLRAWSYWHPDARVLVYPQPEENAPPLPRGSMYAGEERGLAGEEDFAGIRAYQMGDSLRRLAWRQIARLDAGLGDVLVSKQFEGGAASEIMLDFAGLPDTMNLELRLSRMTRWILEAEAQGLPYAFRLGSFSLPASMGPAHRQACLQALALYQGE